MVQKFGDESPPPDIYETLLNHGIYVLPYQLVAWIFSPSTFMKSKKSNQTKSKTQPKGPDATC